MITNILDNAAHGPGRNPEPFSNSSLSTTSRLGIDLLLDDIRDVVSVSHV